MIWAALVGGVAGTLVLTTLLRAASELGLTRMDLPFLLGTAVTVDVEKACGGRRGTRARARRHRDANPRDRARRAEVDAVAESNRAG